MPALGLAQGKTSLQFDTQYRVQVPVGDAAGGDGPGYAVENAQINQAAGRFTAELRVPPGDASVAPIRIAGRLVTMADIPVLSHPMVPGEQVTKDDITWTQVPSANLPAGDVSDPQEMIGRTPRHPLQAGQPLRATDLQVPVVIKRNDPVLIVLERPGLYMTAEGKALEDGGQWCCNPRRQHPVEPHHRRRRARFRPGRRASRLVCSRPLSREAVPFRPRTQLESPPSSPDRPGPAWACRSAPARTIPWPSWANSARSRR